MLELVMWLIVEGLFAAGVFLLVRRLIRVIRHERWAHRQWKLQRTDGTRERLAALRADWQQHGTLHRGDDEW